MARRAETGARATIVDVARAAGVSRQTVSNALNNPERLAPGTLERVQQEIDRLGFTLNVTAQQLRRRQASAYGFEVNSSGAARMGHVLDEFLVELTAAAPVLDSHLVVFAPEPDDVIGAYRHMLGTGLVDGFILADTRPGDPRPRWLLEHGVPFVAFGRIWDSPELTQWVDVDGRAGVRQGVSHLVDAGYPQIAILGWPSGSAVGDDRREGWLEGLRAAGLADTTIVEESVQDLDEATSAADRILDGLCLGPARPRRHALGAQPRTRARPGPRRRRLRRHRRRRGPPAHERPPAAPASGRVGLDPAQGRGRGAARPRAAHTHPDHPLDHHPCTADQRPAHGPHPTGGNPMRRNTRLALVATTAAAALTVSACGGGFDQKSSAQQNTGGKAKLTILIGSSGDAETSAVKDAAKKWSDKSGNTAEVVVASDLAQQLGQGFAGGTPPDVFYADAGRIGDFAKAGNLYAYGDKVRDAGFLDSLAQTFTYDGKLQCAPKDYSTLALVINTDLWAKAGLTDADIPKDWAGLEAVSKKLTSGNVTGLVISGEWDRIGVFAKQAGGWIVSDDGKTATADTPEMKAGLDEAQKMLKSGSMKYAKQVDAGWGGEAIGKGKAAMTIEGNWIRGALSKDFPNIKAKVVELPAGPAGKGTLVFSNCWGIAAKSKNQAAAVDLVKSMIATDQQLAFAKAFGVMPSTTEGAQKFADTYPDDAAFAKGGEYGQGPVNIPGFDPVKAAFNSNLEQLASKDTKAVLADLQKNTEAAIKGQ